MNAHYSIDQVAKRTGLTAHTLRYYERIGLLPPVARAAGGQRVYAATDMAWLEFLLRLRTSHMSIGKMKKFAKLRNDGDSTVSERRQMLECHLQDVRAELVAMQNTVVTLEGKIAHYRGLETKEDV